MRRWTSEELDKIGTAEELEIASVRRDGTLSKPVTIWVVCTGHDLYVRYYRGSGGSWFRAAQARHEGRIRAGGIEEDVNLVEETDPGTKTTRSTLRTAQSTVLTEHSTLKR
jgi:hypothetical protein